MDKIATTLPSAAEDDIAGRIATRAPKDAVSATAALPSADVARALDHVNPSIRGEFLRALPELRREEILAAADPASAAQWRINLGFDPDSVGSMMDQPVGVFPPDTTIREATEALRGLVKKAFITYLFVNNSEDQLVGVVVMREMILGQPEQRLEEIMLRQPFSLSPKMSLEQAMKAVLNKHFPVYPVCDATGHLVGLLRGQTMFEAQAIEISAQAGSMVGVEKEERLTTPGPGA